MKCFFLIAEIHFLAYYAEAPLPHISENCGRSLSYLQKKEEGSPLLGAHNPKVVGSNSISATMGKKWQPLDLNLLGVLS
jgi:hypothetical protein